MHVYAVVAGKNPCTIFEWRSDGIYVPVIFATQFLLWEIDRLLQPKKELQAINLIAVEPKDGRLAFTEIIKFADMADAWMSSTLGINK